MSNIEASLCSIGDENVIRTEYPPSCLAGCSLARGEISRGGLDATDSPANRCPMHRAAVTVAVGGGWQGIDLAHDVQHLLKERRADNLPKHNHGHHLLLEVSPWIFANQSHRVSHNHASQSLTPPPTNPSVGSGA